MSLKSHIENRMSKVIWKPGTMIYPLPAVMVSCGSVPEEYNILTVSWTGTICTDPAMCYISVRPERHSYNIIFEFKIF
jgi:flavin reductase (DIM6/NTAB) family NADH-FMN oxidoreductase RutF